MKILKNDVVYVTRGKDKGKSGKVLDVLTKEAKVLVENINQYKRHKKARAQTEQSEIVTITKPLPVSNVVLICPKCKKQTRVGYKMEKDKKVRVCKKCNASL